MPKRLTTEEFVHRAKLVHGEKYDYTKVVYVDCVTKVCIICPIHGEFWQKPVDHLRGAGCKHCACVNNGKTTVLTTEDFIRKARLVHGNKYDYSLVHKDAKSTDIVPIICNKHGIFYQALQHHKRGSGCPHCQKSYGEERIDKFLKLHDIEFSRQHKMFNEDLFCKNKKFFVDFFLPKYNVVIEFNGAQHYRPVDFFGGQEKFIQQQNRDASLRFYCENHKIKLIEIPYTEYDNIEEILTKELKIK